MSGQKAFPLLLKPAGYRCAMFGKSDNGGLPFERELGHDAVAGLRGKKSFIFEGGHRVAFVAAWPGKVAAGSVSRQPIGTHDIVATALDLAGLPVPADQALDSVSIAPVLLGGPPPTDLPRHR